jgi:hypothetical protein
VVVVPVLHFLPGLPGGPPWTWWLSPQPSPGTVTRVVVWLDVEVVLEVVLSDVELVSEVELDLEDVLAEVEVLSDIELLLEDVVVPVVVDSVLHCLPELPGGPPWVWLPSPHPSPGTVTVLVVLLPPGFA